MHGAPDLELAAALRDRALNDQRALSLLRSLTREVGSRPAGSAADARAVAWAQARARALGLQSVRAEPVPLAVWQRGPASAEIVRPVRERLVMSALANSIATPAAGLTGEVAWYPGHAALAADHGRRARGRIVVIDERTERTRDGSGYLRSALGRFHAAAQAGRLGALAVVLRATGTTGRAGTEAVARTGAIRYAAGEAPIPAAAISPAAADRIAKLQAEGPIELALTLQARAGVEAVSHDVIAEVPGSDLAHEVVLLGAHLDSWDVGEGAADDAAGVAIVLAAAALIGEAARAAGRAPRRTIRVVLFANEENGFDGALAYGHRYCRERHQLVGESDLGCGPILGLRYRIAGEARPAIASIARVLAPLGVAPIGGEAAPGPDVALLARRYHWAAADVCLDGSDYFDLHHSPLDTFANLDTSHLAHNVACWAVIAWLAAQSPLPFLAP